MSIALIALILICIFNLALGGTIFLRNRRAAANISFLLMSAAITFWIVCNYLTNHTGYTTLLPNEIFNRLTYIAGYSVVLFGLIFTYYFPARLKAKAGEFITVSVMSTVVLVLSATPFVAGKVSRQGNSLHFSTGTLLPVYVGAFVLCVGLIIKNLSRVSHKASLVNRLQARLLIFGFSVSALLGLGINVILPSFVSNWQLTQYGPYTTILLVATIGYAMIKHGLFDIRLVVARSLAYVATLAALASLFGFVAFGVLRFIFDLQVPVGAQIFISAVTAVSAMGFARLKKFFDRITNRLFYADSYDPQELFDKLNRVLVSTYDLNLLLKSVSQLLADELKATFVAIELKEITGQGQRFIGTERLIIPLKDILTVRKHSGHFRQSVIATDLLDDSASEEFRKILRRYDVAVLVRLAPRVRRDTEGLGYLTLGPKRSGNLYTQQDLRVLDTVANELILAIQNALHFEEIQNFNKTLQEKVVDATRQLRKTNEKLKALDETKDDFISMASHQLRTPLTSVKGYMSLVLDGGAGPVKPMQRELLTQAFASSQRMVYLISDLLNVSRLKTGKFIIDPAPINLADIISDELVQLKESASTRSVELNYDKPAHFPTLMFDETKTRQVIMNFVDNAIYYTPAGGHIRVELEDKPNTIELRVVDDGIGVPAAEQRHLFTKFYRAGNARKARPDGTGLGLFMAKKVIVAQGGAVIFSSQEGKGSTFGFTFAKQKHLPTPAPTIGKD